MNEIVIQPFSEIKIINIISQTQQDVLLMPSH